MPSSAHDTRPVAILGAGSLGRLWAGYLPPRHAFFLPRKASDTLARYQLQSPEGGCSECNVTVCSAQQCEPSLLVVTTKAGDTLQALESALPYIPTAVPVVLFQNGMGLQDIVANRWPERPILAASTTEGANRPDTDLLVHAGRGQTWIGGLNAAGQTAVDFVIQGLSSSGLALTAEPNIHQRLWNKLVVNAGINAFTALLNCPNGDILSDPFYLERIDALSHEIASIMAIDAAEPMSANAIKSRIEEVARSTANNTSSMRGDILRGRKTEIDFINGYIVKLGNKAGLATPVNQMLIHKVQELTETE
ncbi:2-dehydropantoate 2-reductase [Marinobacter sp. CHS3-4]|uniref:ketopantoate reductase family protein n=1 Tax=Marinobacter sp. CHS3-4 TaxID=3045174 RepID=UPI0024B5F709|nr:2-dehydropantoate 2-reductase [Marinobacter sp. CHS3-4]MDI9246864.1 2-dehydropantoate 2-reductase [Marinobacter sp. CHS3-4]